MKLERRGHEILRIQTVSTRRQQAEIAEHYTMFCHIKLSALTTLAVGQDVALDVSLTKWDDGTLITNEDRPVEIMVDGQLVEQVQTVGGQAQAVLQFADPGTYTIEARAADGRAQAATLEVIVS